MTERQRIGKLLKNFSRNLSLGPGIRLHGATVTRGLESDVIINNFLIDIYAKCGKTDVSRVIFERMPEKNVVSWTSLMGGYLLQGKPKESLYLFGQMGLSGTKANEYTFSTNLKACGLVRRLEYGVQIHVFCIKTGFEGHPVVGNSIIDMYSKNDRIVEANLMFERMPERNLISWNALIAGYNRGGHLGSSLALFKQVREQGETLDEFTYSSVLKACSVLGAIHQGAQLHAFLVANKLLTSDQTIIATALIDMYVKCRCLTEAQNVFDQIKYKNEVSWTTIIVGYAQEGRLPEATGLFNQFRKTRIEIDSFILSSLIGLLADFALVEQGKQLHSYTVKTPSGLDTSVANSIMDMYLKCGLTNEAEKKFHDVVQKNVVSWTVMITGHAKHGNGREAIHLFENMQFENIQPDDVTYLAVLSACSHSGLLEEGQEYFSRLLKDYQIKAKVEHYSCMVDLLCRAGNLKQAKNLIETMPLEPSVGIWQTLLGACRNYRNLEMGREVGEFLMRLDSENPVNYVMMSNIYAEAGQWDQCERIRVIMKMKGLKKEAGRSWIEMDKVLHFFYGGDDLHPQIEEIRGVLKKIEKRMKEEIGYSFGVRSVMHDVDEESGEDNLRAHSEKLAIGLALVYGGLEERKTIRVFKNLRVCVDCHEFIKGLSKILNWVLLVRDSNRFHKFEGGVCSCGDYW
ncbi:putative pentatricopeptide repeat-containing protein At3g15130 [Aristolochia californica]|uniref:putative pentatricopeptide repeat-containing protein At3g15130 n=1 Tax=Aristolochia californica TaxID=171875 RepID=UPI0035DE83F6